MSSVPVKFYISYFYVEFVPNSSLNSSSNGGDSTLNNTSNSEWASYHHQGNSNLNKTVTHDTSES